MEELRGYLWPLPVYERVKKKKPTKDMPVATTVCNGRSIKGVMLDETHGRPVGSIAIYGEDIKYVQKDSQSAWILEFQYQFENLDRKPCTFVLDLTRLDC